MQETILKVKILLKLTLFGLHQDIALKPLQMRNLVNLKTSSVIDLQFLIRCVKQCILGMIQQLVTVSHPNL